MAQLTIGCRLCPWRIPYSITYAQADIGQYMAHVVIKHWDWLQRLKAEHGEDPRSPSERFSDLFPDG